MILHRWTRRGPSDVSRLEKCVRCMAVSAPSNVFEPRRQLMAFQDGSWKAMANCPDTCETTRNLLAVIEVQSS